MKIICGLEKLYDDIVNISIEMKLISMNNAYLSRMEMNICNLKFLKKIVKKKKKVGIGWLMLLMI